MAFPRLQLMPSHVLREHLTDFHCEFHWHSIQLKYKGKRHFVAFTEVDMVKLNQPREVEEQGAEAHEE